MPEDVCVLGFDCPDLSGRDEDAVPVSARAIDLPMRANLCFEYSLSDLVGLGLGPEPNESGALGIVLGNVFAAHARAPGSWIFYSRCRTYYARLRRYLPANYTYRRILAAIDILERDGLIEHRRTVPSPTAAYRSRLRASQRLIDQRAGLPVGLVCKPTEPIILRDRSGRLLEYSETDRIERWRRDVVEQNDCLAGVEIRVDDPLVEHREGLIWVGDRCLGPPQRAYLRIFNGGWTRGGRWYGPFWQVLPRKHRANLIIDGRPVVERDYRACHLRLLCGWTGVELPFNDPEFDAYAVPGFDRAQVKLAFNIMLNAASNRAAQAALARELRARGVAIPGRAASAVMSALARSLPGLEPFWCSGIGLRLQNADAEICRRVQRRLRKRGMPVLSVHDSFIAPASLADVLDAVMDEEMERACRRRC